MDGMVVAVKRGVLSMVACLPLVAWGCGSSPSASLGSGGRGGSGVAGAAGTGVAGAAGAGGAPVAGAAGGGRAGAGDLQTVQVLIPEKVNNDLDLLFMIDNSSGMTVAQQKLAAQIPSFLQVLQQSPNGMPNLHIAVVSSDMGAPGDQETSLGCKAGGDQGQFQFQVGAAATACTATTLSQGSTFILDGDGQTNFTDSLASVVQCLTQLGASGCGFEHQLASTARALGADGNLPPATNVNFLRTDAALGIILLTNEDDCSAPDNTPLFSLNGGKQSVTNPLGPIANYRCNQFGHLCKDPNGTVISPPLNPPGNASGNPPALTLTDCVSNDSGGADDLTPVTQFVAGIKALKADPDRQILVAAVTSPRDPYTVTWVPPASPPLGTSGELWPQIMHSCGAQGGDDVNPQASRFTTDGTIADPAVRITQFVQSFSDSVLASICDPTFQTFMTATATKLSALVGRQSCLPLGTLQFAGGLPACTVTDRMFDTSGNYTEVPVPNCGANGSTPPCWTLTEAGACAPGEFTFKLLPDGAAQNAASLTSALSCAVCQPGSSAPGC